MELGTILSVAQCLYSALHCRELNEVLSIFGYKSQLDELQKTVKTINAVLLDAEKKQEHSHEAQNWIEELKDAVFEADDLFDEFITLAELKQLRRADGSLSKKVSNFFSRSQNPIHIAFRMSRGIKDIKKKLDGIASNSKFCFKLDLEPTRKRRPETCSYVNEVDMIGREDDLESVVGTLLDLNVQHDVSFLSIVGIGGLGKTALAQLVYNDPRVMSAFSLRLWTCVSDQDQQQLDVKDIICKILGKTNEFSTLDQVQNELRKKLTNNKYLLVLDDVWTEKREQWRAIVSLLMGGQRGSWIVVTTRSLETSRIIGDGLMYKLQGLSNENSWLLFERVAFGSEQSNPPDDLVNIGRDLIRRCARVPLAIRVVASLLYGQDKSRWLSFRDFGLANIRDTQNDIKPVLKLSYHHLESPLKSCFSFCGMFPKDFVIEKNMLINMWMAQGYVVPLDEGQSIKEAGEEYFSILTRRCFFQDLKERKDGVIKCKIHDLMHDIALEVSGKEISLTTSLSNNIDKKVRHLFLDANQQGQYSFEKTHIRTIFLNGTNWCGANMDRTMVKASLANCRWLRALHLRYSNITDLPESIGQLLHLRYLNLSSNKLLKFLPKSFTKLYNLQTLVLSGCLELKELPKDFSKLVKLRVLDIKDCCLLQFMPRDMGKLTYLHKLSDFALKGGEGSCSSLKHGLDDLKALNKLTGFLNVRIFCPKEAKDVDQEDIRVEKICMRNKEHLNHIEYNFSSVEVGGNEEATLNLMEELEPHSNLKRLGVRGYPCAKFPRWVTVLANLVYLHLEECQGLELLSGLINLRHLRKLELVGLANLQYIEEDSAELFLPALKWLMLANLPKLKQWRGRVGVDSANEIAVQQQLFFSQLSSLSVEKCPQLTCILMCPMVRTLRLIDFNQRLQIITNTESDEKLGEALRLSEVTVSSVAWLKSLPAEAFRHLKLLTIEDDEEVESLRNFEEVFINCSSSLQTLQLTRCSRLSCVMYGGLEHLNALENLTINCCGNLLEEEKGDGIGISIVRGESLCHSLNTLTLFKLVHLKALPNWMQYLTSLQILEVYGCERLESMPYWMPKLSSLRELNFMNHPKTIHTRCKKNPRGEDFPYIQHIPKITFDIDCYVSDMCDTVVENVMSFIRDQGICPNLLVIKDNTLV